MSKARAKGTYAENRVRDYLKEAGFPYCERLALHGSKDIGDLTGVPGMVWEIKNEKRITLAGYMDELVAEKHNAHLNHGVVVIPRRSHHISRAYAVTELHDFVSLIV